MSKPEKVSEKEDSDQEAERYAKKVVEDICNRIEEEDFQERIAYKPKRVSYDEILNLKQSASKRKDDIDDLDNSDESLIEMHKNFDKTKLRFGDHPESSTQESSSSSPPTYSLEDESNSTFSSKRPSIGNSPMSSKDVKSNTPLFSRQNTIEPSNLLVSDIESKNKDEISRIYEIERLNLSTLLKLIINNLIKFSISDSRTLDYDSKPILFDFFNVFEQLMKHGLKNKKNILFSRKELWNVIESFEHIDPHVEEITKNVKEIPHIRTNSGRCKAFLRIAFVQKKLPDIFKKFLNYKEILKNFYDERAFIMTDDAILVQGLLIGLNVFDCNWCAKDEKLDELSTLINLTPYLQTLKTIEIEQLEDNSSPSDWDKILDQKNYVEELNKQLTDKIEFLQDRINELEINHLFNPEQRRSPLMKMLSLKAEDFCSPKLVPKADFDKKCGDVASLLIQKKNLEDKLEAEKNSCASKDESIKSLEINLIDEKETVSNLKEHLEELKKVNGELFNKLQECKLTLDGKIEQIKMLDQKNTTLSTTITEIQRKLVASEAKYCGAIETHSGLKNLWNQTNKDKEALTNDLEKERLSRSVLQKEFDELKEYKDKLIKNIEAIQRKCSDYETIEKDRQILRRKCADFELTMEEMGNELQKCKLELENYKESRGIKDAFWQPDDSVSNCHHCQRPFTVSVRKHHCRNCGHIFCNACSDNKLPLASSSKPLRVCNECNIVLLDRYSG